MGWTFYSSSGQRLAASATQTVESLDIDGATDIGEAIADNDLFIIDNGAGGTNRKTAASRLETYTALKTTVTYGSRAAATATGSVAYTGAGFTPTAVIIVAQGNTQDNISFGFGDDANAEQAISVRTMNGTHVMERDATNIIVGISGSDSQKAVLTSLDADGITLGWTKASSGEAVNFLIYYMR